MTQLEFSVNGGREASLARRRALSAGQGGVAASESARYIPFGNGVSTSKNGVSAPSNGASSSNTSNGLQSVNAALVTPAPTDGRAAALARRHAQSGGKNGLLSAHAQHVSPPTLTDDVSKAAAAPFVSRLQSGGREASLARRRAVSAGKGALPPATERVSVGRRNIAAAATPPPIRVIPPAPPDKATNAATNGSVSEQGRARRADISQRGRGAAVSLPRPAEAATQAPSDASTVAARGPQRVTGLQNPSRVPVTGEPPNVNMRSAASKVGFARTTGGLIVSGSLVRSNVPVTGDEWGASHTITGEAEQRPQDDLSIRDEGGARPSAQFPPRTQPHGASVFGFNLDRGAQLPERRESLALESTLAGVSVTGTAVGRSSRVTGDEAGACRKLTGDQYSAPERARAECGGSAGASGVGSRLGAQRKDPVTGAKVVVAVTRGGQRVSGVDLERSSRVTSRAGGVDATVTGSQYSAGGRAPAIEFTAQSLTGDVPRNTAAITGTARGADIAITGTAYFQAQTQAEGLPAAERLEMIAKRFSVNSPQRTAQLLPPATTAAGAPAQRITGSFAHGAEKVTGSLEFVFRPRIADREATPARLTITGEGHANSRITGGAFTEQKNVTGISSTSDVGRNPSARAGKAQAFAGARHFASFADREEPKHLVTGMVGYSSDAAAKVTLSGGGQG
jgi:hypothetical protein